MREISPWNHGRKPAAIQNSQDRADVQLREDEGRWKSARPCAFHLASNPHEGPAIARVGVVRCWGGGGFHKVYLLLAVRGRGVLLCERLCLSKHQERRTVGILSSAARAFLLLPPQNRAGEPRGEGASQWPCTHSTSTLQNDHWVRRKREETWSDTVPSHPRTYASRLSSASLLGGSSGSIAAFRPSVLVLDT